MIQRVFLPILAIAMLAVTACRQGSDALRAEVDGFLDEYSAEFVRLFTESSEAEWASNTRIVEGDETNLKRTEAANRALAEFTGSTEVIEKAKGYLERADELERLQKKQLEVVLYRAADNPQTVADVVNERITAEAKQIEALFGFDYKLDGRSVSTNEIDRLLVDLTDLDERLAVWQASKELGPTLKDGLVRLVDLRNRTVQAMDHADYFQYQVAEYGMTTEEMMALNQRFVEELWPLYRELHTWARYELAERYGAEVPELLPAHWLPNRWGQSWSQLVSVEGIDLGQALEDKDAEWVVRQGEEFFASLGFGRLPESFYERSSLYPLPTDAEYKKNNHASAWHIDLGRDVRSLMSVEPNDRWWMTVHHELGHIFYYLAYTRPEVPPLLREGANRGFHEAVGYQLGLASMQQAFLQGRGMIDADVESDEIQALLKEALDQVVFMPWSAGVMTFFERDLYAGLPADQYNARWWEYVRRYQGIEPPGERGESFCDAATKTHINDDAAQYYDYALSYVILHQLHAHVANQILGQNPRNTDYFGRKDVGDFLGGLLELGATRDWREVMIDYAGGEISAKAMLDYYEPLMKWLVEQNKGRSYALTSAPVGGATS
jgi:peptidyl-dipeptidase A